MTALIHFSLDPFSRRMRLALAEYGQAIELIEENPLAPSADIFALNPAGTLPIYHEDSQTAISGVEAIGEYLEETLGGKAGRPRLIPGDAYERAEVRRIAGWRTAPENRCLDLGAGAGHITRAFNEAGLSMTACEHTAAGVA